MAKKIESIKATRQDRRFGINHQYITKKLTPYNYRWYAIVRDSCYLYIEKIKNTSSGKDNVEYRTYGWCWLDGRQWVLDYTDLEWALDDLNTVCGGKEGLYPPEAESSWLILMIPKEKSEEEKAPFAYQFSGFRKDEK